MDESDKKILGRIIGNDMLLIVANYRATDQDLDTTEYNKYMNKSGFSPEERTKAARLYAQLREEGFYPYRVSDDGQSLLFHKRVPSKIHELLKRE